MLNAKSVAMQIVARLNPEWVEENFGSVEELIVELADIIHSFKSLQDIKEAEELETVIGTNSGVGVDFRYYILRVYGVK